MKVLLPFVFLICSLASHSREITMETVAWEPFYSDTLLNNGIINEIVNTAFQHAGYTTKTQFFSWRRAMQNVKEGKTDVLLGAYYTEERSKIYHYSKPIFDIDVGLIALKELGVTQYSRLEDLKRYTIGVGDDWSYGEKFDSATYLNKDPVISSTQNVRKLFRNRVDMIAMAIPVFKYEYNQIRRNNKNKVVILKPLLASQPIYIMVGRTLSDGEKIIADFNKGLDIIKKNGTYDHLLKKHGFK